MAAASAMVRAERDGRSSQQGLVAGIEERAVSLPGQVAAVQRWQDLFGASFEVLLYDATSTHFESDPPDDENDKRRHGCSRRDRV
jgi:hypothetical protein